VRTCGYGSFDQSLVCGEINLDLGEDGRGAASTARAGRVRAPSSRTPQRLLSVVMVVRLAAEYVAAEGFEATPGRIAEVP
jgi:hypothetical protein